MINCEHTRLQICLNTMITVGSHGRHGVSNHRQVDCSNACSVHQKRKHRRPISLVLCKGIHWWLDFTRNGSVMHKTYQCQMINVLCVMPVRHVLICRHGHNSQYFWWKIDTVTVYVNHQRTIKCWSPWSVYSRQILWLHRQHGFKVGF